MRKKAAYVLLLITLYMPLVWHLIKDEEWANTPQKIHPFAPYEFEPVNALHLFMDKAKPGVYLAAIVINPALGASLLLRVFLCYEVFLITDHALTYSQTPFRRWSVLFLSIWTFYYFIKDR